MIHNIFYNSNKEIVWSTTANVNSDIIAAQSSEGLSHVALDIENHPDENYYVNSDATALTEKSVFDFTFSSVNPALDDVITVTGLPEGTKVYRDGELMATTDNTGLTFTVQEPGSYMIKFEKLHYKKHSGTKVDVKRYGT